MRALSPALLFALTAAGALAQETKSVTIHAHFELSIERLTPTPQPRGTVENDVTVILSGQNNIHEIYDESAPSLHRHGDWQQTLGGGNWHVVGPHRLERRYREINNIDIIEINVEGDTCKASWETKLLPGFQVYTLSSMTTHRIESYAKPWMISSTCTILEE
jgi:hypothetical protein